MRNGSYIPDNSYGKPFHLKRSQRCFPADPRPFHPNFGDSHPLLHRLSERISTGNLRGKRGAFSGAFDAAASCAGLGNDVSSEICDRYDGIVKGRLNVDNPRGDVFLFLFGSGPFSRRLSHIIPSDTYFFRFPMTALRGPFLVLAFVLVRCPLTGNPLLCRNPR